MSLQTALRLARRYQDAGVVRDDPIPESDLPIGPSGVPRITIPALRPSEGAIPKEGQQLPPIETAPSLGDTKAIARTVAPEITKALTEEPPPPATRETPGKIPQVDPDYGPAAIEGMGYLPGPEMWGAKAIAAGLPAVAAAKKGMPSLTEMLHATKSQAYHFGTAEGSVSPEQAGMIRGFYASHGPDKIAQSIFSEDLTPDHIENIMSWLPKDMQEPAMQKLQSHVFSAIDDLGFPAATPDEAILSLIKGPRIPAMMQINKTHSPVQLVGALKDFDYMQTAGDPAGVTPKQLGNITKAINSKSPEALASAMSGLKDYQHDNLFSWMTQDQVDAVRKSMADLGIKKKLYSKGEDQYEKELKEYYALQEEHAAKEYDLATGTPELNEGFTSQLFHDALKPMDWAKYTPQKTQSFTPLDIPHADLEQIKQLGFNPNAPIWRGSRTRIGYPTQWEDPRKAKPAEHAVFGSPSQDIAHAYTGMLGEEGLTRYIARAPKAAMVDWSEIVPPAIEGWASHYDGEPMHQLLNAAREQGYDLVVINNIHDIGAHGPQTQYAILNPAVLRAPHAKFDPKMLHKSYPLLGIAGGTLFTYGQMGDEGRYARGGKVKMTKAEALYRFGTEKKHCGICTMFRKPHSCTAVAGHIRYQDTCKLFERKR